MSRLRNHGEKIKETKSDRVSAHFGLIERALRIDRKHFVSNVKSDLTQEFTINLQNEDGSEDEEKINQLVQGLFESEKEILHQRGMGAEHEEYGDTPKPEDFEKYKQQIRDKKVEQEKTLGTWVDYLGDEEADYYPVWFKYLALRSLQKMGKRDRDTGDYSRRSANTLQPFPDLSREALARTLDAIKTMQDKNTLLNFEKINDYSDDELLAVAELDRAAAKGDFAKLYAHFQNEIEKERRERGESTAGEWRHFAQGSDPNILVSTLAGKGTEWCTAGLDVASGQLQRGEFWIYYTYDQDKNPTDPRVAVFLIDGQISEVRGVYGKDQDLELDFVDIAKKKYSEFPGSEKYEKKDRDMKQLTLIDRKTNAGEELSKDDLIFIYEINSKIEGFGHGTDPRVTDILATRNPKEDAPVVLDCQPDEIAWNQNKITDQTKLYIGPLFPKVFQKYQNLENIYTSFPEGIVRKTDCEIGGLTKEQFDQQIMQELKRRGAAINQFAQFIENSPAFTVQENREIITLVRLKVRDLFNDANAHTTDQIFAKAEKFGLELCPPEVGPRQRLADIEQPLNQWYAIAMKPIKGLNGLPGVFRLEHDGGGLWLDDNIAKPGSGWGADNEFMFRLRPSTKA